MLAFESNDCFLVFVIWIKVSFAIWFDLIRGLSSSVDVEIWSYVYSLFIWWDWIMICTSILWILLITYKGKELVERIFLAFEADERKCICWPISSFFSLGICRLFQRSMSAGLSNCETRVYSVGDVRSEEMKYWKLVVTKFGLRAFGTSHCESDGLAPIKRGHAPMFDKHLTLQRGSYSSVGQASTQCLSGVNVDVRRQNWHGDGNRSCLKSEDEPGQGVTVTNEAQGARYMDCYAKDAKCCYWGLEDLLFYIYAVFCYVFRVPFG